MIFHPGWLNSWLDNSQSDDTAVAELSDETAVAEACASVVSSGSVASSFVYSAFSSQQVSGVHPAKSYLRSTDERHSHSFF